MKQEQIPARLNAAHREVLKARKKTYLPVNAAAAGFGCAGIILLIPTVGMLRIFGIPVLIVCLVLIPAAYSLSARRKGCRWLLYTFRILAVCMLTALLLSPVVCRGFEREPRLYEVKRFIFTHGVRNPESSKYVMPYHLPDKHDDYWFRTESGAIAQDYTPFAFLFIRTDTETLRACEKKLAAVPDMEKKQNIRYTQEELEAMPEDERLEWEYKAAYQNLPLFIYEMMTQGAKIQDDLSEAVVYMGGSGGSWHCGSGALINYETGLLIAWI